ncbi:MAG: tRNA guanosine(15) transglycosylase TgtA [Nitrosopumilaceae archaeon]
MFEIKKSDLAGRIGILYTNHGKIETPAYVPVVHPVRQSIPPKKMRQMGFDLVITNAYITLNNYGEEAVRRGIHDIINYDGAVMTDSGGYQVLEYGKVDVDPVSMASFEQNIRADIAIPLDRPTGYGLSKKKARSYVDYTLKVSKEALKQNKKNDQIWVGPIQGGEHFDLVKRATKTLIEYGFEMLALGSPVEFMESYEYKLLANMIITAKKQMPDSIPLHLFGAGHPMTIPLAVALGCDTFDSASYMLYAKRDRYLTEDGTIRLDEMGYFSCKCEVCSKYTPKEILMLENEEKMNKVALHNLFAIKAEVERVKEAIHEGRLWEHILKKSRSHPKLFETIDVFTKNPTYFTPTTPRFKEKAVFLFSKEDQFRPEILSFHRMARKFKSNKDIVVVIPDGTIRPFYLSKEYNNIKKRFVKKHKNAQFCQFNPFLGIIPLEISDMYPAAHYVMPRIEYDQEEFPEFTRTWKMFFENNNFTTAYVVKDRFLRFYTKMLTKKIKVKSFSY